jgi:hypothetical protein
LILAAPLTPGASSNSAKQIDLMTPPLGTLTACVSRKWAGRGPGSKMESSRGAENCQKTRRLPLVGCTLCWAALCYEEILSISSQLHNCDSIFL